MRKIRALVHRRATIAEKHFMTVPTDNEDDVEGYVYDVIYGEAPQPHESEVCDYDDDIEVIEVIEVIESDA